MRAFNYTLFNNYILRTPLLDDTVFNELLSDTEKVSEVLKKMFKDSIVKETIYLASPEFYRELEKWIEGRIHDKRSEDRIKQTFLKYLLRMSNRCTPFGLFAGVCLGKFSNRTIQISNRNDFLKRKTRIDMHYMGNFVSGLLANKVIRSNLQFYVNNTLYEVIDKYRYVEYSYSGNKRKHRLVSIEKSEYLEIVLRKAKEGGFIKNIAECITSDEISEEEANSYIHELIDCQVLVSELEPELTGTRFFNKVFNVLSNYGDREKADIYSKILLDINTLDENVTNPVESYVSIQNKAGQLGASFNEKYLLQVDLKFNRVRSELDQSLLKNLEELVEVLYSLNHLEYNKELILFKKKFQERYGDDQIPLAIALDVETGIEYPSSLNYEKQDLFPIDDKTSAKDKNDIIKTIQWNKADTYLLKLLFGTIEKGELSVELDKKDIENELKTVESVKLPSTVSALIRVDTRNTESKVFMNSIGGKSAANVISRFGALDKNISKYINEIFEKEEINEKGKIVAEVIHLPHNRLGNVLLRDNTRKFEIPYLAKSSVSKTNQININDLYIRINQKRIVLWSKANNKEVIPRMTTAHNFIQSSLPIYRFLCDLQIQDEKSGVSFNWGPLQDIFPFLPRVTYKNVVVSLASWKINTNELISYLAIPDDKTLLAKIAKWKQGKRLPKRCLFENGDRQLVFDFGNALSVRTFLQECRKKQRIQLKEYLPFLLKVNEDGNKKYYSNELVISFFKNQNK